MLDARAGSVIANRYRLQRKLGQGGMGSVWQAQDRTLRIEVALKLVDPIEPTDTLARFQREAHAAARLRSTHIVHVNDYGIDQESGTPYIAMDLLEGESLSAVLRRQKRLSFEHTRRLMLQVARALRLAHERRIVHRDLKPDNVFIAREGDLEVVKVLDFGIAKRLDSRSISVNVETQVGQILGTPCYMSPEQARAKRDVDHRTDIWSFGVIVYECVTGQRPFEGPNPADVMLKICGEPIPVPSQVAAVPACFDAWFARAVARERDERFATIDEAAALLAAIGSPAMPPQRAAASVPPPGIEVAAPSSAPGSVASPVVSSIALAGSHPLPRPRGEWLGPATLLLALLFSGLVYVTIATPGASSASVPPQNAGASAVQSPPATQTAGASVSAQPPALTQQQVESLLALRPAPVRVPPPAQPPAAARPPKTTASVSQAAAASAPHAEMGASRAPAAEREARRAPAVVARTPQRLPRPAQSPAAPTPARAGAAQQPLDQLLDDPPASGPKVTPPEEYDPGI